MIFVPDTKIYVNYATGIMQSFTEALTIKKYKNNLLYFKEKSSYYAVECHNASFYGYSYTTAGRVIITKNKWQIPFALLAEKMRFIVPARPVKTITELPLTKLRLHEAS